MKLLVVSATKLEIAPSLASLRKSGAQVLISGVGAATSVYAITRAIQQFSPQLIIQAGIAGSFDRRRALGEVFAISQERFGDLGVQEKKCWRSIFDMGFVNPGQKPFKAGMLPNPHQQIMRITGLEMVQGVTVNEISTNKARIRLLKDQGAVVESMEGAALHYVGLMEKIPFLQVRALSNYVGERDKSKWNFKAAIDNLNNELVQILEKLPKIYQQ